MICVCVPCHLLERQGSVLAFLQLLGYSYYLLRYSAFAGLPFVPWLAFSLFFWRISQRKRSPNEDFLFFIPYQLFLKCYLISSKWRSKPFHSIFKEKINKFILIHHKITSFISFELIVAKAEYHLLWPTWTFVIYQESFKVGISVMTSLAIRSFWFIGCGGCLYPFGLYGMSIVLLWILHTEFVLYD